MRRLIVTIDASVPESTSRTSETNIPAAHEVKRVCYNKIMRILRESISKDSLADAAVVFDDSMVKGVVDVKRGLLALDAELHADLEKILL